jgi:hypothetical protein
MNTLPDPQEYFSNTTLLPMAQSKFKEHIRGLEFWKEYVKDSGLTINPNAILHGLGTLNIRPLSKSVMVNGEVTFSKNHYDITINQSLFHFYLHACLLFVSNILIVKGTGITLPNIPKSDLLDYISSKGAISSGVENDEIIIAVIQLIKEFWEKKPFSSFFIEYANKLEIMHLAFAGRLLDSMVSFVVAHELAHVLIDSENVKIGTSITFPK